MAAREGVGAALFKRQLRIFESPALDGRFLLSRETDLTWDKVVNE